ncbi:MAG: LuxR C-terminal-related transcriptional regulator [Acidimicrobiales bacterium]
MSTDPPSTAEPITVVIADDHQIWRSGVRADLGAGFEIVGEAADAAEAVEVIRATRPTLVLSDLHMPHGGGQRVARECGDITRVIILSVSEAERDLLDAIAVGAVGYLLKSTPSEDLRTALRAAAAGEPVFSPSLAALVLGEFRKLRGAAGPTEALSEREREVLQYVARGHSYREIGEELFIATKTVENHVRNTLRKLHLNRKHELVRYALEHGIE